MGNNNRIVILEKLRKGWEIQIAGMVSEKSLAACAAPLVDVVDIAAIAAGLRKGSAVSGGDSSEGDGAAEGGRNIETPTPFPVSSQIGTGGLSRQNSLRRMEPNTLAAASAQVHIGLQRRALGLTLGFCLFLLRSSFCNLFLSI